MNNDITLIKHFQGYQHGPHAKTLDSHQILCKSYLFDCQNLNDRFNQVEVVLWPQELCHVTYAPRSMHTPIHRNTNAYSHGQAHVLSHMKYNRSKVENRRNR